MANQRHHEQRRGMPMLAFEGVHLDAKDAFFRKSDSARLEQVMRANLIEFTARVERYNTPASVLDALDDAIAEDVSLMVLGAKRFAMNPNDRENLKVGENVFIHKSVPDGWWDAYFDLRILRTIAESRSVGCGGVTRCVGILGQGEPA